MTAKPLPDANFIPSLDYHAWKIRPASRGFDAMIAEFAAHSYFWWIAHALATEDAISVPSLIGNPVPDITGFVVVEQPGVYRVELLGPAAIPGRPRTGTPISTIYSIHAPDGPSPSLVKEWNQILLQYGSKNRCSLPARSFITVIKHKYEKLDTDLAQAVAYVSDCVGYAAWLHSTGQLAPSRLHSRYLASLPAMDEFGRKLITGLAARAEQIESAALMKSIAALPRRLSTAAL